MKTKLNWALTETVWFYQDHKIQIMIALSFFGFPIIASIGA